MKYSPNVSWVILGGKWSTGKLKKVQKVPRKVREVSEKGRLSRAWLKNPPIEREDREEGR